MPPVMFLTLRNPAARSISTARPLRAPLRQYTTISLAVSSSFSRPCSSLTEIRVHEYTFDATQKEPKGGRIVIAYGRDAADVALATQFGPATLTAFGVWVEEDEPATLAAAHAENS